MIQIPVFLNRIKRSGGFLLWSVFGAGLFLAGCGTDEDARKNDRPVEAVQALDASQFRGILDSVLAAGKRSQLIELVSKREMFGRVFRDLKITAGQQRKLESAINRGGNLADIADNLFETSGQGGQITFLRQENREGSFSLVYRMVEKDPIEVQYFRFDLVRTSRNKIRIADIYMFLEQQSLVSLLRQRVLRRLKEIDLLESKSGQDLSEQILETWQKTDSYQRAASLLIEGQWEAAASYLAGLPESMRSARPFLYQRLLAARHQAEVDFDSVVAEIRKRYPDEIRVEFQAIGYYRSRNANRKTIQAVDRIYSSMRDPYLKHWKLDALIESGELELAREIIDQSKKENWRPRLILVHELELAVSRKDYPLAVAVLQELKELKIEFENMEQLPRYAELLKSSEYRQWKSDLRK